MTYETAIPAFIGYTQRISHNGLSLLHQPKRIQSLKEYEEIFGFAENTIFSTPHTSGVKINKTGDRFLIDGAITDPFSALKFRLYYSLQLYYANGGGPCYIVSCGQTGAAVTPAVADFEKAFDAVQKENEPTLLLMTDALTLSIDEYYGLYTSKALAQAACLKNRMVLIDPFVAMTDKGQQSFADLAPDFRTKIGTHNLSYGAAYYPWLRTTLPYALDETQQPIVRGTGVSTAEIPDNAVLRNDATPATSIYHLNSDLYNIIRKELNTFTIITPPSPAIAGVYAFVDRTRGVWKAPANVSLNLVKEPMVQIDDEDQNDMNVTPTGKSVNAIRTFSGKGVLVWGARTLAGNDNEWRYISVRRFFSMVEESLKQSTEPFIFEPNDRDTWSKVRNMIEDFLTHQWRAGALQGRKPQEAFFVRIGLGETMTDLDILEGRLIVEIGMAMIRPAEFIVARFHHNMVQTS